MREVPARVVITGELFLDQNSHVAQLHGVGILRVDDRFYAWGEDKSAGGTFTAVACYSSTDMVTWRYEGDSLSVGEGDLAPGRVVERPKVLYNPATFTYVMFLHVDSADYTDARVGFAVSDSPAGPYRYVGSTRPLGNVSRDIGAFRDDDGRGYLLSEDRANGLHIYLLAEDFLHVERLVSTTVKDDGSHGYESPALVKHAGLYYLFGSDLTGWSTNDNKYATASDLAGPWSAWSDFAKSGSQTFDSQISTVVPVHGAHETTFVYVGDRWDRDDLYSSAPVWLPMRIENGTALLEWVDRWSVDVPTGHIAVQGQRALPPPRRGRHVAARLTRV